MKYEFDQRQFNMIPGYMIAYWAPNAILKSFGKGKKINDIGDARQGIIPGNVNEFLRYWHEVDLNKIGFNHKEYNDIQLYKKKWFPYNKGGAFRRWYGNIEHVINMENNGYDIKYSGLNNNYRLREPEYYFKECISWSKISSGLLSMRYIPTGVLFDIAGCSIFNLKKYNNYVLAIVNSKVVMTMMEFLGPTLNFEVEQIKKIPIIFDDSILPIVNNIVEDNIDISKEDWDEVETSICFKKHPLV